MKTTAELVCTAATEPMLGVLACSGLPTHPRYGVVGHPHRLEAIPSPSSIGTRSNLVSTTTSTSILLTRHCWRRSWRRISSRLLRDPSSWGNRWCAPRMRWLSGGLTRLPLTCHSPLPLSGCGAHLQCTSRRGPRWTCGTHCRMATGEARHKLGGLRTEPHGCCRTCRSLWPSTCGRCRCGGGCY